MSTFILKKYFTCFNFRYIMQLNTDSLSSIHDGLGIHSYIEINVLNERHELKRKRML